MGKIADENEILEMYTAIMRREVSDKDEHDTFNSSIKPSDVMKAGEAILKRLDAAEAADENKRTQYGVIIMPEIKGHKTV